MSDVDIYHFGVKGMKWGVRKKRARGYNNAAYNADRAKHGTLGANRINKNVLNGASLQKAQKMEAERHRSASGTASLIGFGGGIAGGFAGRAAGTKVTSLIAYGTLPSINKYLGTKTAVSMAFALNSDMGRQAVSYGMSVLGAIAGNRAANAAALAAKGYSRKQEKPTNKTKK